jgi:membrane protease YdiL (CAAX protease family)
MSIGLGIGYGHLAGVDAPDPGATVTNLAYGVASLLVVAGVYAALSDAERDAVFRFERPTRGELGWTVACLPLGVAAFLGGTALASAVGFDLGGYAYTLADPTTVVAVVFGAVLVAPLVEEVLFRGLLLGSLLGRGRSPALAGAAAIFAFGAIHLALLGVAGVIATALWATFPPALRIRYDNLTGAWLLHLLNNVWSYLVVVALGLA